MRGVVFDGSTPHVVTDLDVRDPGPGELLVGVRAAGLCHSDVSVLDGTIGWPSPAVLGHEGAGVVEAVGAGVSHVAPGDHVVLSTLANCGRCRHCDRGRPTMCRAKLGRPSQPFTWRGRPAYDFANLSVFAERIVVQANQAVPVPREVPFEPAALLGCGVLTGTGAALNRAKVRPGAAVAVLGVGGIGLNAVQGCRIAGASRIIAVDANPAKEEAARTFGATDFVHAAGDAVAAVKELTGGAGVDYAFECVGLPALVRAAVDMLDWDGTCVLLGVPRPDAEAAFRPFDLFRDRSILGCRYGGSRPQADIPLYADLYLRGVLKLDEMVTRVYALEDFATALKDLERGDLARGVFRL